MIPITREVRINIPIGLAEFIEDEKKLALREFCQRVIIDILIDYKKNSEVKNGEERKL